MIAQIYLWDVYVGALNWNPQTQVGEFEYTPEFVRTGLEISPVHMPLRADYVYVFQGLDRETFKGLPSILADSLPDDFGNALIDAWLAQQGRSKATFTPVERLLYQGERGMGALEYRPALATERDKAESIQIDALVRLASEVLSDRESIAERLNAHDPSVDDAALQHLIHIGTSAGGARAKAVIAIDAQGEIRSGQVTAPPGFEYWLLKFDVAKDSKLLADSQGYGRIEYAYHLMAKAAGIRMTECRLLEEGGRAHFMTKRFDRTAEGEKIHMATLCALDHADFRKPGQYSYAEAFGVMRALRISRDGAEQFYRRMVFNLVARNQDDHTKNTAFMMDTDGTWYLTPAYDVSYSYLPGSFWVDTHQMTVNGKRDDFTLEDLLSVASQVRGMDARRIIKEVCEAVAQWRRFAREAGVPATASERIGEAHRLYLGEGL
ncbi:type II toxin-antitoxin system HipA family toxin [Pseudomonas sichuanensis]|uniref:type II toxin-antitoxin system HipA family toxin n=1 Tax=Pseudomonas sichuanensis TaxID=2213015 RepID=UPI00215E0BC9|nr:type II toxin-antitoxin system HipA family toxin [Pseudomonas sichuanensis]UVK84308.1 type II toxin-antitoxin system HipA family toxin [Pseudomonas sichuanensis]